jgi:hypothetical protein
MAIDLPPVMSVVFLIGILVRREEEYPRCTYYLFVVSEMAYEKDI